MKKTSIQILLAIMLLLAGCVKDELSDIDTGLQLKKGRVESNGIVSYSFRGNSINNENHFDLIKLQDGSIILKDGYCSGKITSFGTINATLSKYSFSLCKEISNVNGTPNSSSTAYELDYNYLLTVSGGVVLN